MIKLYPEREKELQPSTENCTEDIRTIAENGKRQNNLASGGSNQVLADFFEFTDYLSPHARIIRKCRSMRPSKSEDAYSGLMSF